VPAVDDGSALSRLADLLRQPDVLDMQIAAITKRSARQGDVGELIAAQVFDIELAGDRRAGRLRRLVPLRTAAGQDRQHQGVRGRGRRDRHQST